MEPHRDFPKLRKTNPVYYYGTVGLTEPPPAASGMAATAAAPPASSAIDPPGESDPMCQGSLTAAPGLPGTVARIVESPTSVWLIRPCNWGGDTSLGRVGCCSAVTIVN